MKIELLTKLASELSWMRMRVCDVLEDPQAFDEIITSLDELIAAVLQAGREEDEQRVNH